MSILIILLKIIAIILAVILVFLLLCLFHPVFYQVEGVLEEDKKPVLKGSFWWLFQILRLHMLLSEGKLSLKLRVFGIGIDLSRGSVEEPWEDSSGEDSAESAREGSGETEREKESCEDISKSDTSGTEENIKEEHIKDEDPVQEDISEEKPKEKKFSDKFKKKHKKQKKQEKKQGRFSAIKSELSDEKNKLALSHVWREVLYLLSHLKPKYAKGEIDFSAGDPALTGEVTGMLSLCPLFYRYKIHVYPDFASDKFYVRGNLFLKGHMSLYQLVLVLIRLMRDKNFRRLIKKIRK